MILKSIIRIFKGFDTFSTQKCFFFIKKNLPTSDFFTCTSCIFTHNFVSVMDIQSIYLSESQDAMAL